MSHAVLIRSLAQLVRDQRTTLENWLTTRGKDVTWRWRRNLVITWSVSGFGYKTVIQSEALSKGWGCCHFHRSFPVPSRWWYVAASHTYAMYNENWIWIGYQVVKGSKIHKHSSQLYTSNKLLSPKCLPFSKKINLCLKQILNLH